jgi:fatty-acyl-CoA synthase
VADPDAPGSDAPAAPATVAELVRGRSGDPDPGVRAGERAWSWAEVVDRAEQVARWLAVLPGDGPRHVGVLLENTPEYLFTLFGAALAGVTVVGLNSTRRGAELARDVQHTDCRVVLTDGVSAGLLDGVDLGTVPVVRVDEDWPPLRPDATSAGSVDAAPTAGPGPEDVFVLIFTSGSTGAPKAVRMTHARAARMATTSAWFGPDDVLYAAMPLFHGNALNAIVLPALSTGASIALARRFSASEFMPCVRRDGATFFSTIGRALAYILATPETAEDRDHHVKYALAPESSPADMRAFKERFGIPCFGGYGSSENAIVMVPVRGMPSDALGAPAEGIDAAVVDPETGEECPPARFDDDRRLLNAAECIGELVGRNVVDRFEGYYNNPEADAARTRNGWYWSGDLAYRDEDGLFYFAGRSGDWVRVDGENFAVAPVERILARLPGAAGVAVFAVPDERTADDQLMAAVELAPGETFDPDAFEGFLAAQSDLGPKWVPRYVRVGRLPVGATNKLDRATLRRDRWFTDDPVFWRAGRSTHFEPFTADDLGELRGRFERFERDITRP